MGCANKPIVADSLDDVGAVLALAVVALEIIAFIYLMGWL